MYADEDERDYFGSGMPKGNKPAGFVGLMIAKKHLGRTPDSYDPTAREKSTPELFDMDVIRQPSKYIQENLYAESTRIRRGIQKVKETIGKQRQQQVVRRFVKKWKEQPTIAELNPVDEDDFMKFMKEYNRAGIEGVVYNSYAPTINFMFLHLLRKYKNDCVIASKTKGGVFKAGLEVSKTYKSMGAYDTKTEDFAYGLKDCVDSGASIVVLPFSLPQHANLLLYRPTANTLERFEPHGNRTGHLTYQQNKSLNDTIVKFFNQKVFKPILERADVPAFRFIPPQDIQIGRGFQAVENAEDYEYRRRLGQTGYSYQGFCVMWSMFYLELCLKFPNLTGREVVDKAMESINKKDGTEKFLRTILGYTEEAEKELKKLVPTFSFQTLNMRYETLKKEQKADSPAYRTWIKAFNDYNEWFDNQIKDEMTKVYARVGARARAAPAPKRRRGAGVDDIAEMIGSGLLMSSCCPPSRRECKVGSGYYGGFMKGLEYIARNG